MGKNSYNQFCLHHLECATNCADNGIQECVKKADDDPRACFARIILGIEGC